MSVSMPVALKLDRRSCLVVGNGAEAVRRLKSLARAGASLTLISPTPGQELAAFLLTQEVTRVEREFVDSDLDGVWLAVLCDRDERLAARMSRAAEQRQVFFCAVDQPLHNSFAHVGIARSGPLFLAVGTEGKAPALARRLTSELSRLLESKVLRDFVVYLAELRERTPPEQRAERLMREARRLRFEGEVVIDDPENDTR